MDRDLTEEEHCEMFRRFVNSVMNDMICLIDEARKIGLDDNHPLANENWQSFYNEFLSFCRKWGDLMSIVSDNIKTVSIKKD